MISPTDSPIIHPSVAAHEPSAEAQIEARKFLQRFDAVPLIVGALGLIALTYLLERLISPFVIIIAVYMMLTPFREYRAARTMMWTAGFIFAFWFLVTLSGLLVPFILGAFMAYLMHPMLTVLETRYRVPRVWGALGTILVFVGSLAFLGWWTFPQLAVQAENIFNKLSNFVYEHADNLDYAHLQEMLVSIGIPQDMAHQIVTSQVGPQIKKFFASVPGYLFTYAQQIPFYLERTVNLIIIFPVSAFYFMKDWPKIGPLFLQFLPAKDRARRAKMFGNIDRVLYGFIRGQLLMATIVGVLATICYYIMGVPYAGILGIMVGVTDLIPIIGIIFSGVIIVIVLSLTPPAFFDNKKKGSSPRKAARKLFIPETLYRRMINHCLEERPLEACGLLSGVVDQVEAAYATDNEQRSPYLYKIDDRQLWQVMRENQAHKHEIIGIYHSHVQTEPVPSQTDIRQATWPEALYLIVSLAKSPPEVRAWRIVDSQVTEHQVVVRAGAEGVWQDLRQAVQATMEPIDRPDIP